MCRFKSGILLKDKVILAPGGNESHSDLLVSLDIKDDYLGASKTFVRAELIPKQNQWWVSPREYPEQWEFVVDQDITPEWFDREEREKAFREAVCEWWESHVIIGQKMDRLNHGYYRLKECEIEELRGDAEVFLVDSRVGEMQGSSRIREMWGSSRIGRMCGSSRVGEMRGNSCVGEMWGSSRVGKMRGNSCVGEMWGSSCVGKMWGSSRVGEMWGSSRVGKMQESSSIGEMQESSSIGEIQDNAIAINCKNRPQITIQVADTSRFILKA